MYLLGLYVPALIIRNMPENVEVGKGRGKFPVK